MIRVQKLGLLLAQSCKHSQVKGSAMIYSWWSGLCSSTSFTLIALAQTKIIFGLNTKPVPGPTLSIWLLASFKERIPKWKTKKRQDRLEEEYCDSFVIVLIGTLTWLELLHSHLHNKLNELFCATAAGFRNFPLCFSAQGNEKHF